MSQLKSLMVATVLFGVIGIAGAGQVLAAEAQVAKVGSVVITQDDLQLEMKKLLPKISYHGSVNPEKIAELEKEAKESVISRAYKVNDALDQKISLDRKVVDANWAQFVAKNPGVAKAAPAEEKILKEFRYRELLAAQAEAQAVDSKVVVNDEEVRRYYETNKNQYYKGKLFKASHIMVKVDPSDNAEAKEVKRQKAQKLFERAKSGEDFFNLAYYESDDRSKYVGGSLGSFHAGQMVPEFDDVIQKMKVGDIAGPVQTLYGYHILKLDDVQEARQLSLEETADKVRSRLQEEKRKKIYDEWMSTLKQKYPLQVP